MKKISNRVEIRNIQDFPMEVESEFDIESEVNEFQDDDDFESYFTSDTLEKVREKFKNFVIKVNEFAKPSIIQTYWQLSRENDEYLDPKYQKKYGKSVQNLDSKAIEFFQTELNNIKLAIGYAQEEEKWERVIEISENLRRFLSIRTYWDELEEIQEYALEAAIKAEDNLAYPRILNQLGEIDRLRGRAGNGINKCEESRRIFQSLNDEDGEAKALYNLGYLNRSLGNLAESAESFEAALKLFRSIRHSQNMDEDIAEALDGLGQVYTRQGKLEQAKKVLLESLGIKQELDNRFSTSKTYNNLGKVYIEFYNKQKQLEYLEEAKKLFEKSLEIKRELGDRQGEGTSLNELGKVHRLMNECEKAIDYYNKSLEVKSKVSATEGGVPDRHGQGLTYMEMGLLYEEQREEEKATNYFQLALDYLNNYSPEFKQISKRIQKT